MGVQARHVGQDGDGLGVAWGVPISTRYSVGGSGRLRLAVAVLYLGIPLLVLGLHVLHATVVAVPRYTFDPVTNVGWDLLYSGLLVIACYAMGLPELPRNVFAAAASSALAAFTGAAAISIIGLLTASRELPRFVVLGAGLGLIPLGVFSNWLAGGRAFAHGAPPKVLIVGTPGETATLDADMARDLERPAAVGALLTPEAAANADTSLLACAADLRPAVIVLSASALTDHRIVEQAGALHENGTRVRTMTQFYEEWMGKLPAGELERSSLLFDIGELHRNHYGRVKRIFDAVGALLMAVPLVLILPFVLLANAIGSRGPLFYRQPRVGKGGQEFTILKFRTMRPDEASSDATLGGAWTTHSDPRITPVGRVLRTTHLDELPQVLNVLRGELSLVGPRPEQPAYVAELTEKLPYYDLRHVVRPGLTGWAQVRYAYGSNHADALEKLQFDFFYLRHQGLRMDARCIVRTLRVVTHGQGR